MVICFECGGEGCQKCNNSGMINLDASAVDKAIDFEEAAINLKTWDNLGYWLIAAYNYNISGRSNDAIRCLTKWYIDDLKGGDSCHNFEVRHLLWILLTNESKLENFFIQTLPAFLSENRGYWIENKDEEKAKKIWFAFVAAFVEIIENNLGKYDLDKTPFHYTDIIPDNFIYAPALSKILADYCGWKKYYLADKLRDRKNYYYAADLYLDDFLSTSNPFRLEMAIDCFEKCDNTGRIIDFFSEHPQYIKELDMNYFIKIINYTKNIELVSEYLDSSQFNSIHNSDTGKLIDLFTTNKMPHALVILAESKLNIDYDTKNNIMLTVAELYNEIGQLDEAEKILSNMILLIDDNKTNNSISSYKELTEISCLNCNTQNKFSAKFCMKCGTSLVKMITCPNCESELTESSVYCDECGLKIQ